MKKHKCASPRKTIIFHNLVESSVSMQIKKTSVVFFCNKNMQGSEGKMLNFSYNSTLWQNARCNLAKSCF